MSMRFFTIISILLLSISSPGFADPVVKPTPTPKPKVKQELQPDPLANLGTPLNTKKNEFSPSLTADGKTMIFNSRRAGEQYQNLYISRLQKGKWSTPQALTVLNSPYNDETPFIAPNGKYIFFASDRDGSMEMARDSRGRVKVSFDLYMSQFNGKTWGRPQRLPGQINSVHHERSPSFDGRTGRIYYATWPFGNFSKSLIMTAQLVNGQFKNPRPLPPSVNAGFKEIAPVYSSKRSGLYFSSRRPGGLGGWDIYFVKMKGTKVGKPENLGIRYNSPSNDLFLSFIGKKAYLCSNRPGGQGRYDIFSQTVAEKLNFLVLNKETRDPLEAEVILSTELQQPAGKTMKAKVVKKSDQQGRFLVWYNPDIQQIKVRINKEGFLPLQKKLKLTALSTVKPAVLELIPIKKDGSFDVHAINFDYNSDVIKEKSYVYLDSLVTYLKENPELRFKIIGHTDLHGSAVFNQKLSLRRARSVRNYLVSKGVQDDRFELAGAGKSRPLQNQKNPAADALNRRTEFKLLK